MAKLGQKERMLKPKLYTEKYGDTKISFLGTPKEGEKKGMEKKKREKTAKVGVNNGQQ